MAEISTKPYLIRAIYEWCSDSGLTPYLNVKVDDQTHVPIEYVKNGEIVLNVSQGAARNLTISNELVQFSARFNGVSREVAVPMYSIQGIFARENGQGAFFNADSPPEPVSAGAESAPPPPETPPDKPKSPSRGKLKLVK